MHFVTEYIIHHLLECTWTVTHTKEHDNGFIRSNGCDECSFPFITIFDMHIVVPSSEVHLCIYYALFELIDELGDQGQRVVILDGAFIEIPVIDHHVFLAILLWYEKYW